MKFPRKENTPNLADIMSVPSCLSRPSFRDEIHHAEKQIEIQCFDDYEIEQAREICAIIAEVRLMRPDIPIKIAGELLDSTLVKQVFDEITASHVRLVIGNFNGVTGLIRNKRAYLRTALYNSVFELEAHYKNLVNHDFA